MLCGILRALRILSACILLNRGLKEFRRVINHINTLEELEDVLIKAQPKGYDYPASHELYISALDDVKTIIAGGHLYNNKITKPE